MTAASPRGDAKVIAGRFRLLSELGAGGFGQVFKAEDLHANGALRAVKTLKPNVNVADLAKRFEEEARALSSLKHAGVPKCWDFGEDESFGSYFVLDYIEGQTLLDRLEKGAMPLEERFQRAIEFFDVLDHVHNRGILHRDIKPENLMVPRSGGHLILLDFGIAKDLAQSAVHTATGVILGTPYYLTPEQLSGERYTAKSDLYQAALVTYWLLTGGVHCFVQVDSVAQLLIQRQMAPRAGALERTSWYGRARGHMDLLLRCLEPNPSNRPGTARVVHDALVAVKEAALGTGSAPAPTVDGVAAPVKKASGRVVQPTAVAQVTGVKTAEEERPSITAKGVTSGGGRPTASLPDPVSQPLRAVSAIIAITLIGVVAVIGMQLKSVSRVDHSPSLSVSGAASSASSPLPDDSALARELRVALPKAKLDLAWLSEFASAQRNAVRKAPASVATVLRSELAAKGVLSPLERFLTRGQAYFADASITQEEKWATRSALADLMLIEYFCRLHSIPWERICSAGSAVRCVSAMDEPARPWLLDLRAARTWGRHRESTDFGYFPGRLITDRWVFPVPKVSEKVLLWYRLRRWRESVILDISIASRLRRILAYSPADNHNRVLPAFLAEWIVEGTTKTNWMYTPDPKEPLDNGYLACWVPAGLYGSPLTVTIKMVELPLGAPTGKDPILYARCVSLVPRN